MPFIKTAPVTENIFSLVVDHKVQKLQPFSQKIRKVRRIMKTRHCFAELFPILSSYKASIYQVKCYQLGAYIAAGNSLISVW